jgi:predicted amidohydrolase YtcJ
MGGVMNRLLCVAVASLVTATALSAPPAAEHPAAHAADLLLTSGRIYTPSGWAQSLAVRSGTIVAIGETATVDRIRGPNTRVIDLKGGAVFPGLHDLHVHSMFAGLEQFTCRIPPGALPAKIASAVKACVQGRKPGEWIIGGNWVAAVFAPSQINRAFLDRLAPANPVLLNDESHHSIWVNSTALRLAGITRDTPNPAGGIIERDAKGEPNGLLRETATALVESIVPPASDALKRDALVLSSRQMLSYGITSYTEATVRAHEIATFAALSAEGVLKQRVRGCIVWAPGDADGERLIAERASYARPRFATDCVKIFMDGVPTESRTGAMLQPYVNHAHGRGAPERGILMVPQNALNEAVTRFDRQGLHVKFHAAGDAAVRAAIDAVFAARGANGWGGSMHDVGHSTFVDSADIRRVREAHMAFEYSPYIWYPTPIAAVDVFNAVGAERMRRWVPIKDGLASGALVVAGSDWSVVPSVNPWLAMETMVTRQNPGGSTKTLGDEQRITLEQALRIFTANGALLMQQRDEVGAIEVGMRADLVVTEGNPFDVPITQVHATKVMMTFIDGDLVYEAAP